MAVVAPPSSTVLTTSSAASTTPSAVSSSSSTTVAPLLTSSSTPIAITTSAPSPVSSAVISSSAPPSSSSVSTTTTTSAATSSALSTTSSSAAKSVNVSSRTSATFVLQTSENGEVFTQTSIITVPVATSTESPAVAASSAPTSFFGNKGAVAGVFSVVGVVGLVLVFLLVTSYVRRRRARKLDREIDEAAAEAATAQPPDFDDFDFMSNSGMGGAYGHYSETSHGTYSQPPLSHEQQHHNIGAMQTSYDPYPGMGTAGSGAAGIGARGRSVRNGVQHDPFGALAHPPEQYEMQETGRAWQPGNTRAGAEDINYDLLQVADLAASDPYAVAPGVSTNSGSMNGLMRSRSQGPSMLSTPAQGYPGGQSGPYPPEKPRYSASYAPVAEVSTMPPDEDEDPFGGIEQAPGSAGLENPHPALSEEEEALDEKQGAGSYLQEHEEPARASFADDEDYGYNSGQRVLRVANV